MLIFMIIICTIIFFNYNINGNYNTNKIDNSFYDLRIKRAIQSNMKNKWNFPIKYYVEKPVNETTVDNALKIMMRETCVTFKKSLVPFNDTQGLRYFRGIGCWSITGLFYINHVQDISLGEKCDTLYGSVQHETSHALGLYHEQSRLDRDKYIKIIKENVKDNLMLNFNKTFFKNSYYYGTQYDFGSGMQYGLYTFSKNKKQTIFAKNEIYSKMIGQRYSLSFNDYKLINMYYCTKKCSKNKVRCKNYGYPHPHYCGTCKCPNGYEGKFCDKIKKSYKSCGKTKFKLMKKPIFIKGNSKKICTYSVYTNRKYKIKIKILNVNTTLSSMCYEKLGLEVKYRLDKGAVGACYCGYYENQTLISEDNKILIQYTGKTHYNYFKIKVEKVFIKK
ncbi:Astacin-like metalloendopeptidase [Strongyloides ratti]|uniref:Metalloendopeptidase n=1 Tax=Strongyloides ratti TaxID=34506 RepID=A0A090MJU3_STRRB|nr:Astacin-like metalloendopeptidase [Strongyloides ratti]CEG06139.1 Astacin-like metalloendopeptidase [Strongyloides ratti]